ncbi:hypothetical protein QKW35_20595 [Pontibacterium granulatum]|uniref:hypothetical protein n=1 Tax=Pontibacterium granulatum TaxID=2036029 RepID=UPI00249C930B|nr:hypothetical protein [Pontibacterium granulatum]MDI3326783.1 hypothetical protein [Pontibacterium granulatum]
MTAKHGHHFGGAFFHDPTVRSQAARLDRSGCVLLNIGRFRLAGTTKIAGTPAIPTSAPVWLLRKRDHKIIQRTRSDANGNYAFEQIPHDTYTVLAFDESGTYNAVIADNLESTP